MNKKEFLVIFVHETDGSYTGSIPSLNKEGIRATSLEELDMLVRTVINHQLQNKINCDDVNIKYFGVNINEGSREKFANLSSHEREKIIANFVGLKQSDFRHFKHIKENGVPELINAIDYKNMPINLAYHISKLSKTQQRKQLKKWLQSTEP